MSHKLLYATPERLGIGVQSFSLLLLRWFVAGVFLQAGVQKISNFATTQMLFQYEYRVPLLPPDIAAYLGTATELVLPVLLLAGLLSRWAALGLFVFNIIAVISYPTLSKGEWSITHILGFFPTGINFPTQGFEDHVVWGVLLLVVFAFGAGRVSLDYLLVRETR